MTDIPSQYPFTKLPPELRIRIWELSLPSTRLVSVHCGADMPDLGSQFLSYVGVDTSSCPLPLDSMSFPPSRRRRRPNSQQADTSNTDLQHAQTDTENVCKSIAPIPAHLHACVESRTFALSHYSLSFSYCGQVPRIFFRPETDILYFGPRLGYMASNSQLHTFLLMNDQADLATVRRIAIDDAVFWNNYGRFATQITSRPLAGDEIPYSSLEAVGNTVNILREIRHRMPALEEVIFLPQGGRYAPGTSLDDVRETMRAQVQTSINDLSYQMGERWTNEDPRWSISEYPLPEAMLTARETVDLTGAPITASPRSLQRPRRSLLSPGVIRVQYGVHSRVRRAQQRVHKSTSAVH